MDCYYKLRQLFYYKLRQVLQSAMDLLQIATGITNCAQNGRTKCWPFSQATTNTPFDFHIYIHYLQVDKLKLSNTSTAKPTEEKQADTEEDNGTNNMQAQCSVTYFVIILLFILIIAINCPDFSTNRTV